MKYLDVNPENVINQLAEFICQELRIAGFSQLVVGLSGGIDSAVAAALAVKAIGGANVLGVKMPWKNSSESSLLDADAVGACLGIQTRQIEITPIVESSASILNNPDPLRLGNIMARARMMILFDIAAEISALPLGTSNKTELLLGYGTLHGDLASAINPLAPLYKRQVFILAEALGLPEDVIQKAPSADLEPGQTDEDDIGWTYELMDRVLYRATELSWSRDKLIAEGFDAESVNGILDRSRNFSFKANLPIKATLKSALRANPND
jgi:NAD+ synthase